MQINARQNPQIHIQAKQERRALECRFGELSRNAVSVLCCNDPLVFVALTTHVCFIFFYDHPGYCRKILPKVKCPDI